MSPTRAFVFYGTSGSGKTTLAGTFPGPILFCDCRDRGTDSLDVGANIDVKEIETWEDVEHVYWFLKKNPKKYKTVVWDTMSHMQDIVVEAVLEEKGKDTNNPGEWGKMTRQEWGMVAANIKPMITSLRDLPMNMVFIAQHRIFNLPGDEEDEGSSILDPEVGPQLMPSVMKHLNASVSVIGNTFIRTRTEEVKSKKKKGRKTVEVIDEREVIEYCLRIGPNPVYTTKVRKSRSIKLPDVIVDPDYDKIMKVLKGK